ncbi:glutamate:gamma-aminobutyrate antiporter [Lactococcus hodotermopsidis]|uniref:Glutamate:gamma-aminobutyrate antiporter n=1 Tax=Pseudolactococcus hodotermopsidis TaxID=2709157 RepID=A0A6A0B9X2_9LACT|nr:amino acid permease [Lactococcus hodotermopsidis]GFH42172.1 glutamate:gamma-aminobutyrate antiporter [Lactococcus hodotermopsidis]
MATKTKQLTLFGFFALTASMVLDVYEYPTFATSQLNLIFFLIVGGLLWFFPAALCSAEMATIPEWEKGGVFTWVSETLGEGFGFMAIFFQWFQITVGFVTMIYFMISALSNVLSWSALDSNPILKTLAVLVIFWLVTLTQLGGTGFTDKLVKFTFALGIVLPAVILLALCVAYVLGGNPLQFTGVGARVIPDFRQAATLVVFVSFILSYMGVEASATYSNELKNVQRNYPIAMLMLVIFAIVINSIGGLSVGAIIPVKDLSLSGGVLQAFEKYLAHFGLESQVLLKVFSVLIALGILGEVTSWVVGPARGLFMAAQKGLLPPIFRKTNQANVPVPIVLLQGGIVSIWVIVLTLFGGGNNLSFQVALSLTATIYDMMYLIFFIAYLVLVHKMPTLKGDYQVFGGKIGKTLIASSGIICSLVVLGISFVVPSAIAKNEGTTYQVMLVTGFLLTMALPVAIYQLNDKTKHKVIHKPLHLVADEVNVFVHPKARGEHRIVADEERN